MYNATLYLNTGFNAVNVPDSLATLNLVPTASKVTVPALDIYQARELSSFVVKANYSQIRDADYLYLVNSDDNTDFAFYSVQNVEMTSMDTAVVYVTMDYILTAGGASTLEFTDGICERHHVAKNSDNFGAYDEDDPYISPAEMMKIEEKQPEFYTYGSGVDYDGVTLLESTVDLRHTWYDYTTSGQNPLGVDYTSADDNVVTVPSIYSAGSSWVTPSPLTKAIMQHGAGGNPYMTNLPHVTLYVADQGDANWGSDWGTPIQSVAWINEALGLVRSLGIESCILNQYVIPAGMITGASSSQGDGSLNSITGKDIRVALTSLPFETTKYSNDYSYTVQNKRLFYGNNCQYTITSIASGNSASFLPEDIIYDASNNTYDTYPTIEMRVDPRPEGCPYFRFDKYRGIGSAQQDKDFFFINAVKGLQWQNAPLVYTGGSGSLLNQYDYASKMWMIGENYDYTLAANKVQKIGNWTNFGRQSVGFGTDMGSGAMGSFLSAHDIATGNVASGRIAGSKNALGIISSTGNLVANAVDTGVRSAFLKYSDEHAANEYNIQKNSELADLLIANEVVAPSMNFPISEGIRDYVGNLCIVYRHYYSENDIKRLDKVLNMYGYRHTVPIESSLLTNRSKFNYIQAKGVTIKDTGIPKWIRDGVSVQLSAGTRIWHQLPDISAYTDGTNV